MRECRYCNREFDRRDQYIAFCSVSCQICFQRYEKQINVLHTNLILRIFRKRDSRSKMKQQTAPNMIDILWSEIIA